jgi:hypothetical protein
MNIPKKMNNMKFVLYAMKIFLNVQLNHVDILLIVNNAFKKIKVNFV